MSEAVKQLLRFSLSLLPDHLAGGQVVGHVFDEDDLEKRFVVELLIDGFPAALARAERFDADLARDGFGDGCYGFGFFVDATALSSAHVLEVRLANGGEALGAPVLLQGPFFAGQPPLPQSGAARWLGGLRINGSLGPEAAGRRVRALIGGQIVAEGLASHWTHVGEGRDVSAVPGFDLHLPERFADGCAHFAQICDENGRELAGSPVTFVAFADGLARFLGDRADIEAEKPRGEIFDLLFPQSLPFSMFAQWRDRFEPSVAEEGERPKIGVALIGERAFEASVASLEAQQGCEWVAAVLEGGEGELGFPNASLQEFLDRDARDCAAVVFAPCGVVFQPLALARLAQALAQFEAAPIAYGDFTFAGTDGGEWPVALPAFDYERLLEQGCGALLFAMRMDFARDAVKRGAADLFRLFQCARDSRRVRPVHTPGFLARLPVLDLVSATRLLARATEADLRERGVAAKVEPGFGALLPAVRVRRLPPSGKVSFLVPTRERVDLLQPCIDSLFATVDLTRHEVIMIDNDSSDPETLACFERLEKRGVRIIHIGGPFNFARLVNKGASIATGEFLLVLQTDVAALKAGWLDEMLGRIAVPDVGAVGASLMSSDGVVRHGGFTLGPGFDAAPAFNDRMEGDAGYGDLLRVAHEVSAVTAACLLTRSRLFLEVGGFDGQHFPVTYHDVDYCLRLRERGLRIVQTPHARLLQTGASGSFEPTERRERERRDLRAIWGEVLAADPYYNPLLSLDQIPFTGLAWPPRPSGPRQNVSAPPRVLPPGF